MVFKNYHLPIKRSFSDTLVLLCTYNERGCIETVIDGLLALKTPCDILVVDDGSTDGTLDVLARLSSANPNVAVLVRPQKLGIGSAHKLGWLHARRAGYARIATLDADLSHDPADVQRLLDALDAGADLAIGSRFAAGGRLDYGGLRRFVSHGANAVATLLLRLGIAEHTTSLRAAKLSRIPDGLVETIERDGYGFFITCIARLARARLTIAELPIHFRDREHGISKISKREIAFGAANLLWLAIDRRRFVPAVSEAAIADCPDCGQPYRITTKPGNLRCVACFGIGKVNYYGIERDLPVSADTSLQPCNEVRR
jgi:dolichol-phosphate mannosyltransferase